MQAVEDLTIIVPIALMAGRLNNLEDVLQEVNGRFKILLMHDVKDEQTGLDLENLVEKFNTPCYELHQSRYGSTGAARNAGLELVTTKWVGFWDSDDSPIVENYIEFLGQTEKSQKPIGVGEFIQVNELDGSENTNLKFNSNFESNLSNVTANPGIWRFVFKSVFAKKISFPNLRIGEEQVFLIRANLDIKNTFFYNKPVYKYIKGSSLHTSSKKLAIGDLIQASRISYAEILKSGSIENYKVNFYVRQIISGIKNGDKQTKVSIFLFALFNFSKLNFSLNKKVIKQLFKVIGF
jgi:glycosyltransferase involved in cell wall biosynthesis